MKNLFFLTALSLLLIGCNKNITKEPTQNNPEEMAVVYRSIGDKITEDGAISIADIAEKYKMLAPGDTVGMKVRAEVKEVCQNKGCWMKVEVGDDQAMVKFKDYGFFMPKDLAGSEVIMEGVAFVEEMSVEDQRHFAEDAGKSQEEIDAITTPKRTLSFISSGVLIPESKEEEVKKQ